MNNEKPIKEVLSQLLHSFALDGKVNELNLKNNWESIVGGMIARRTDKIMIKNGKLHIWVSSSPLKQELSFHKQVLVDRVNAAAGSEIINEIVIR